MFARELLARNELSAMYSMSTETAVARWIGRPTRPTTAPRSGGLNELLCDDAPFNLKR
jgi:hypothetical protein